MPQVKIDFSLNSDDYDIYVSKLEKLKGNTEDRLNKYLHGDATTKLRKEITKEMPRSNRNKTPLRGHAKDSEWYHIFDWNLAAALSNRLDGKRNTDFWYLYFPHEGKGTSRNHNPNPFAKRGIEKSEREIVEGLFKNLNLAIEEEL